MLTGDSATDSEVAESAEDAALRGVERDRIWRMVLTLPKQERIAISLFYLEDLPYATIATVMDVSLQQVRNYIHRGRRKLQSMLEGGECGEQ